MFENRRFLVIPTEMVEQINFEQVLQSSKESLRYSIDGTKTFVKYEVMIIENDIINISLNIETGVEETTTISAGIYGRPDIYNENLQEYNHADFLEILETPEWSKQTNEL